MCYPKREMSDARFAGFDLVSVATAGEDQEVLWARRADPAGPWPVRLTRRPTSAAVDDHADAAFLAAAGHSASFDHPGLVATLDVGREAGRPWVAHEVVDGVTAARLVEALAAAGEQLDAAVVVLIAVRLADALAYVHAAAEPDDPLRAHGAVGPDAVWLTRGGAVKLDGYQQLPRRAPVVPPEVVFGARPDARADLFGLGVVVAELAHGRPLEEHGQVALHKVLAARADLPNPLVGLVLALAAPYPEQRPPLTSAQAEELDLLLTDPDATAQTLARVVQRFAPPAAESSAARLLAALGGAEYPPRRPAMTLTLVAPSGDDALSAPPPRLTLPVPEGSRAPPLLAPAQPDPQKPMFSFDGSGPAGKPLPPVVEVWNRPTSAGGLPTWLMLVMAVLSVVGAVALAQVFVIGGDEPSAAPPRPPLSSVTPSDRGRLTVTSDPPGATVYIGGVSRRVETPATLTDEPINQAFTVSVSRAGFLDPPAQRVMIDLTRRQEQVHFRLKPLFYYRLESEPSGAQVSVNGRRALVTTPVALEPMSEGERVTLELSRPGAMPERLELVAGAATATVTRVALRPARTLVVESTPSGAWVRVNGLRVGRTPLAGYAVPLDQPAEVAVERPDSRRWTRTLTPRRAGEEVLKAKLQLLRLDELPLEATEREELARILRAQREAAVSLRAAQSNLRAAERQLATFKHQRTLDLEALEVAKSARDDAATQAAQAVADRDAARTDEVELRAGVLQRLERELQSD